MTGINYDHSDVTWAAWRLKSVATPLIFYQLVQASNQRSALLVRTIYGWPMDSPDKGSVMRKISQCHVGAWLFLNIFQHAIICYNVLIGNYCAVKFPKKYRDTIKHSAKLFGCLINFLIPYAPSVQTNITQSIIDIPKRCQCTVSTPHFANRGVLHTIKPLI